MPGTNAAIGGGGFHHVALKAKDFDRSVRFYVQALGFREELRWGEGDGRAVMLDTGDGSYLEIFAGGKGGAPEGVLIHFALRTINCDAAIERARAAGAQVTVEPQFVDVPCQPPARFRIAFCKGPDGEAIEFFQG